MGEDGFTVIPNYIFEDESLNKEELLLLITLLRFNNKDKGYAYPSYRQIKDVSKIKHDQTLINSLNSLINKGYVIKETVKGIGNKYVLPTAKIEYLQKCSTLINEVPPTAKIEDDLLHKCSTTNTNTNTNTNTKYNSDQSLKSVVDKYTSNQDLSKTINEFIQYRKIQKKPLKSEYALNLILKKLDKIANCDKSKIEILNNSIMNGWQGIFEIKQKDGEQKNGFSGTNSKVKEFPIFDKSKFLANADNL